MWREADRADRLRYSQPARCCDDQSEPLSNAGGVGTAPAAAPADTHYAVLGVEQNASQAQIRRAYLRLLVTAHPDRGGKAEHFQQLQAAFALLSDPAQREIYDEKLERLLSGLRGSSSTCSEPSSNDGSGFKQGWRRGGSAVAVVHGQVQGGRQQTSSAQHSACPSGSSAELHAVTAEIRALSSSGASDAARSTQLAAAHLRRAALHREAGLLHHALFDAEEALALQPDSAEAAALVASLHSSSAAGMHPRPGAALPDSNEHDADRCSSRSSSDDDCDMF